VNVNDVVDIATRHAAGIEVALIWDRRDKSLVVFAYDALTQEEIVIPVTGDEALEVYRHPFAYADRSVELEDLVRESGSSARAIGLASSN
jgi:hypothetical protein